MRLQASGESEPLRDALRSCEAMQCDSTRSWYFTPSASAKGSSSAKL